MNKIFLSLLGIVLMATSCSKKNTTTSTGGNRVLMLQVDYTTSVFEGGYEFSFGNINPATFTITKDYQPPGDFGNLKLNYQEMNEPLFDGTIIWMGKGKRNFPQSIASPNSFEQVDTEDLRWPQGGFENIFNESGDSTLENDRKFWIAIQSIVKVRQYIMSNTGVPVKFFLYQPSVGAGDPKDWKWIAFVKN